MSNHIELFIERVVGLMADRLDERNKANKAKIRAMMIARGHKDEPYLEKHYTHNPETGDNIALIAARKKINSTPTPKKAAEDAKERRIRAAQYKYNVGKVDRPNVDKVK